MHKNYTRLHESGYLCPDCGGVIDGKEPGAMRLCRECEEARQRQLGNQMVLFPEERA